MIEEWDITATNQGRCRGRAYEVAVLAAGAIEPHNFHLPLGQDYRHASHVARAACQAAWDRCQSVLALPPLPYGVDCNLMAFPMAVHVSQAALDAMVREIIASVRHYGIRKFVLVNGHGGNDFVPLVRQIQQDMDVFVFLVDWWKVGHDRYAEIFTAPDDHAGQFETSVALELYPELVELDKAGDGSVRPFRFEALRKGWARTSRDFARLSDQCAAGDPSGASAERGRAYLDLVIGRIADFLVELAQAPIDKTFPFLPSGRA
ncbi:MAG TPA: creatininase family protein [Phycisphaerae bacterium]|nr:creatininase family protein [Phycisphaerae bacterium]